MTNPKIILSLIIIIIIIIIISQQYLQPLITNETVRTLLQYPWFTTVHYDWGEATAEWRQKRGVLFSHHQWNQKAWTEFSFFSQTLFLPPLWRSSSSSPPSPACSGSEWKPGPHCTGVCVCVSVQGFKVWRVIYTQLRFSMGWNRAYWNDNLYQPPPCLLTTCALPSKLEGEPSLDLGEQTSTLVKLGYEVRLTHLSQLQWKHHACVPHSTVTAHHVIHNRTSDPPDVRIFNIISTSISFATCTYFGCGYFWRNFFQLNPLTFAVVNKGLPQGIRGYLWHRNNLK